MASVDKNQILDVLSKVQEPELHKDLVSLNMIQDIQIKGETVQFRIVLTTPPKRLSRIHFTGPGGSGGGKKGFAVEVLVIKFLPCHELNALVINV